MAEEITIQRERGPSGVQVVATFGLWAIHRTPDTESNRPPLTVTHVPTGHAAVFLANEHDAYTAARWLDREVTGEVWQSDDVEKLQRHIARAGQDVEEIRAFLRDIPGAVLPSELPGGTL